MEVIIIALLLVIIYQLHKNREKASAPAFTEEEWLEAVNNWYAKDFMEAEDLPFYTPWTPPPYEEVKNNPRALETLRAMAK